MIVFIEGCKKGIKNWIDQSYDSCLCYENGKIIPNFGATFNNIEFNEGETLQLIDLLEKIVKDLHIENAIRE